MHHDAARVGLQRRTEELRRRVGEDQPRQALFVFVVFLRQPVECFRDLLLLAFNRAERGNRA